MFVHCLCNVCNVGAPHQPAGLKVEGKGGEKTLQPLKKMEKTPEFYEEQLSITKHYWSFPLQCLTSWWEDLCYCINAEKQVGVRCIQVTSGGTGQLMMLLEMEVQLQAGGWALHYRAAHASTCSNHCTKIKRYTTRRKRQEPRSWVNRHCKENLHGEEGGSMNRLKILTVHPAADWKPVVVQVGRALFKGEGIGLPHGRHNCG